MYDFVAGRLVAKSPTDVVIDVNGMGFQADVSLRTSERLSPVGSDVRLLVHLKIQDDRVRLFGFVDEAERELFLHLLSVAGIGPAHALAMLSSAEPGDIWQRLRNGDSKALARTKGIGPKIAQRACVELGDRARRHADTSAAGSSPASPTPSPVLEDAISALLVLGYSDTQARKAAEGAVTSLPTDTPLEDIVREALSKT